MSRSGSPARGRGPIRSRAIDGYPYGLGILMAGRARSDGPDCVAKTRRRAGSRQLSIAHACHADEFVTVPKRSHGQMRVRLRSRH